MIRISNNNENDKNNFEGAHGQTNNSKIEFLAAVMPYELERTKDHPGNYRLLASKILEWFETGVFKATPSELSFLTQVVDQYREWFGEDAHEEIEQLLEIYYDHTLENIQASLI